MPRTWFNIARNSDASASIDIFDEIGAYGVSAKQFITDLRALKDVSKITLKIDCPGGDCNDGFTIFDALKASKAVITADIIGCAASMASVIMLAASKIRIAENGRVMIHRVTGGAHGSADDLDAAAKVTKQFEDRIVKLYMARTGADEATIRDYMKAELGTWFFGTEAVAAKFADELITGIQARAFQPRWAKLFKMLPAALFDSAATVNPEDKPEPEPMKLTAENKTRLIALLLIATASLNADEKTELSNLQTDAKADGYDPTEDVKVAKSLEGRKATMKKAGLTDAQITAALKVEVDEAAKAALQKKKDALKASGLTDKQAEKVLANSATASAQEAKIQKLKDAGLSDAEIKAALKTGKSDTEDGDDDSDDEMDAAIARVTQPLRDEITALKQMGLKNLGGGPPLNGAKPPGDGGEETPPTNEAELKTALAKCKDHTEKRALIAAFDKSKKA